MGDTISMPIKRWFHSVFGFGESAVEEPDEHVRTQAQERNYAKPINPKTKKEDGEEIPIENKYDFGVDNTLEKVEVPSGVDTKSKNVETPDRVYDPAVVSTDGYTKEGVGTADTA